PSHLHMHLIAWLYPS
uniref:Uncharacterized protein n=1 Tax=Solanum lycopersicum TaxID=4081 RepID=A0A3Q7G2Y2_SOLLC